MPDSRPAPSVDIPPPPPGTIPPPPPPNAPPASTNALGTTTPTATATLTTSIGTPPAADAAGKKSIVDAIINSNGKDMTPDQIAFVVFVTLWFGFGLAGFIMSLWCLGFSGSASQKFGGFLFAVFLGPFYWLYFYSVPSYCARLPPPSTLF